MKKTIFFAAILLAAASCQESLPKHFEDINGVYFNNRTAAGGLSDSTNVTFVYEAEDRMEVPVKISLVGRPSQQDRAIALKVTSENAIQGTDFILPEKAELPADSDNLEYRITLIRSEEIKHTPKTIFLELMPSEEFSLPVTGEKNAAGQFVSALKFRIIFSDMFTSAPTAWHKDLLGEFTQQKFELVCKVLEINPADFNDPNIMTLSKSLYISQEMKRYISAQVELKNSGKEYDKDAFDSITGEPLDF